MKKLLSIMLSFVILLGAVCTSVGAAYTPDELDEDNFDIDRGITRDDTYVLGDVNADDMTNAVDSFVVRASLAGAEGAEIDLNAADFDADGKLTAADSYSLKTCIAGRAKISDFENGNQIFRFTIGGYDISEFSIVIEEDCQFSDNEYMAAELFQEFIPQATGVELSIERATRSKAHGIYIHDVDKSSELGAELGNEGYKYEVVDGDLHIYGTDRGNMYAAYEIIEDYLGFGFINNDYLFLYKQRYVDIEEGLSRTFVPGYRFRQSKSTFNTNERFRMYYALPRGINGAIGFAYDAAKIPSSYYGEFVGSPYIDIHSMHQYHQMATGTMPDESFGTLEERYLAKHASGEPHDETEWEPCATSDDQYNKLFTGLREYIDMIFNAKGIPFLYEDGTTIVSWSLCDNTIWCTCRNCSKSARESNYVDVYLRLKNRGAEDIQEFHPGLKLYSLMYDKELPINVIPSKYLVLVLGGTVCANHPLGSGEECPGSGFYSMTTPEFEQFVIDMVEICSKSGAELWTWYYPDSAFWFLYDAPNIYTIYYDVKWFYEHGVTGFYYEGNGLCPGYTFENLKAYMYSQIAFDPEMSFERYNELIKDYLYMVYGDGWENMWEFLQMYVEAGDMVGYEGGSTVSYCFMGAYSRAFDFVSFEYIRDNYEYMRSLVVAAIDEFGAPEGDTLTPYRMDRLYRFLCVFDLLGLGATYVDSYLNGDEESRAVYLERYTETYNYYLNSGMNYQVATLSGISMPSTINLDTNPFIQFTAASMRPHITQMLSGK